MPLLVCLLGLICGSAAAATRLTRAATCTFTDAASASQSAVACQTVILDNISVPAGTTLDLTNLADNTAVTFDGTTTFGYEEWSGPLISFAGNGITIQGAVGALIDFGGQAWWDGKGSNGGKTKPKAFSAHNLINSKIQNLAVKNTPVQFMSIDGAQNLHIINVSQDNSAGDTEGAYNTDAFDVGDSTGVYISGATVHNQDDCLAVNSGTQISFTGGSCTGGHGLSIGSVGGRSDNTVENVYIANNRVIDSQNGVRIKTVSGATGLVHNVTYTGITLSGISDYGIVVEQDYENEGPNGKPTNGVLITDLIISGVSGSVQSSATDVFILCGSGSCSDWTWEDVSLSGGKKSTGCENIPESASC